MIVNLNTFCKVQLNEFGKVVWLSQVDSLPEELKKNPEIVASIQNKIDEDGCITLELWGIMSIFGPHVSPDNSPFATSTIQISKNPNFGKHS